MMRIKKIIIEKLDDIEKKENVKILHAVESGSRAWGFASPDSDYDVRFIYVRRLEDYLALNGKRDVIEWQLDETLDINGWDLKKALQHFHKSNATLFERSNSPITYRTTTEWKEIYSLAKDYFSVKSAMYHYYGTAKSNYHAHLQDELVKYKKYFYVIRPLLACRYIKDRMGPPPVLFADLINQELPQNIRFEIERLLEIKANMPEVGTGKRIDELNQFIENGLTVYKEYLENLSDDRKSSWDELNAIMIKMIK